MKEHTELSVIGIKVLLLLLLHSVWRKDERNLKPSFSRTLNTSILFDSTGYVIISAFVDICEKHYMAWKRIIYGDCDE